QAVETWAATTRQASSTFAHTCDWCRRASVSTRRKTPNTVATSVPNVLMCSRSIVRGPVWRGTSRRAAAMASNPSSTRPKMNRMTRSSDQNHSSSAAMSFAVYGEDEGVERTFPMDLLPRIIPADEWSEIELGLVQRVTALNRFLDDLYVGERAAVRDGIVPSWLISSSDGFRREAC